MGTGALVGRRDGSIGDVSPDQNLADFTVPIEQAAAECFRAARHTSGRFGAWYYILRIDGSVVSAQDWVLGRNGVKDTRWLDRVNVYSQVLHILDSARDQALADGKSVWRVLLMAGDDSGASNAHMVFDDDPRLDEWDFDPVKGLNLVNKAMPILDIWAPVEIYQEHIWSIGMPFRDEARRLATRTFGTAYGVVRLVDEAEPVLRTQVRTPGGETHDDWAAPDLATVLVHHATRYRQFYRDNGYTDWTTACFAVDDQGTMNFKAMPDAPDINGDLNSLVDHARPILDM